MLQSSIKKNDRKAMILILSFSVIVFLIILGLSQVSLEDSLPFDVHIFAFINSSINTIVAILLLLALVMVLNRKYLSHRNIMLIAMGLSIMFLISYICHHLFAGETKYGDINHDGLLDDHEKLEVGSSRFFYYVILLTHIPLAGLILPLILFTAYRGLTGEFKSHKRLARITWPVWFYVAVSGVIIYWMIRPYYP